METTLSAANQESTRVRLLPQLPYELDHTHLSLRLGGLYLRGFYQPKIEQREDDPDRVRDLQRVSILRFLPGRSLLVRLRSYHRYRA
jgi:hypothetical protein